MRKFMLLILGMLLLTVPVRPQEMALPHVSVAHVRAQPRHGAELVTQALMGMPLRALSESVGGWLEVELPDGYRGFIIRNSVTMLDSMAYCQWRRSERVMVTSLHEAAVYDDSIAYGRVCDIVPGDILRLTGESATLRMRVELPDGRKGWVFESEVRRLPEIGFTGVASIIGMARAQMGVPYLWGGLSTKGMDCSGLTKLAFFSAGYILPRDASQQALAGMEVNRESLQPGDLVFYGNQATGRINHVAIYEGDGMVIEAAGRVKRTPLDDAGYFITARRMTVPGVMTLAGHRAYFCD